MTELRCSTRVADAVDRGVAGVIFDIGNQNPGAFLSEQRADGFADSVCATGNDSNLIFQPVHVLSRVLRERTSYRFNKGRRRPGRRLWAAKDLVCRLDDIAG